ncbi:MULTISPECIES: DUF1572 family protein [Sphingobacterium]|uniref:DUF1572 family protein n=1 Tax=Sphingobacterium populi TaxID=1812824 RepID=A0ABW5U8H5_9SPHI|nr:DUF1572 family protein [Sphingobacterium sp. CFCC 11742]
MMLDYLNSAKNQFAYYKKLGNATFDQLTDDQLFEKNNNETNSIANIVMHLSGNMLSRWTDFLTTSLSIPKGKSADYNISMLSNSKK